MSPRRKYGPGKGPSEDEQEGNEPSLVQLARTRRGQYLQQRYVTEDSDADESRSSQLGGGKVEGKGEGTREKRSMKGVVRNEASRTWTGYEGAVAGLCDDQEDAAEEALR